MVKLLQKYSKGGHVMQTGKVCRGKVQWGGEGLSCQIHAYEGAKKWKGNRKIGDFTLIELLVVIAIIAILASILLPSLNRAVMSSRTAKCQGNVKQMFLVHLNYIDNYNDCILPSSMFGKCWGLVLHEQKLLPGSRNIYADGCGIIRCPEEKKVSINLQLVDNYHYGLNSNIALPYTITNTNVRCFRYSKIKNPSGISFMMDSTGKSSMQFNALTNIARRHLLSANVLYLDGHVVKERLITGSYSSPFWSYGLQP